MHPAQDHHHTQFGRGVFNRLNQVLGVVAMVKKQQWDEAQVHEVEAKPPGGDSLRLRAFHCREMRRPNKRPLRCRVRATPDGRGEADQEHTDINDDHGGHGKLLLEVVRNVEVG